MANKNLPIVDWLEIEASAPGKIIISGEYSVVYEKHAIASAVDLRTTVIIRPNKEGRVRLNLKNLNHIREWPTTSLAMCRLISKFSECLEFNDGMVAELSHLSHPRYYIASNSAESSSSSSSGSGSSANVSKDINGKADNAAMAFLLLFIGLGDSYASSARPSINVEVESTIPVGSGLGSSSAFSVALCGALMRVFRVSAEKYIISNWAFNIDKLFHGKPSGVDNNVITTGGTILFQGGKVKATGTDHKAQIKVMLIDTGVSRSTRYLSDTVVSQMRQDPTKVRTIFNTINDHTNQIWRRICDPEFVPKNIATSLQSNQNLLDVLGVGHEKLADICARAIKYELTAKQTGAGGGGIAFVLYDDTEDCKISKLRSELKKAGYRVYDQKIACDGLLVKLTEDPAKQIPATGR